MNIKSKMNCSFLSFLASASVAVSGVGVSATLLSEASFAASFKLDGNESHFVVLTQKGGIASGLAHNHVIQASNQSVVVVEGASPELPKQVEFKAKVQDLVVDEPSFGAQIFPRLKEIGLHSEPFVVLDEDDRAEIKKNMLADDQLHIEKHPEISVKATNFASISAETKAAKTAPKGFVSMATHQASFAFSIRGKTVTKTVPLIIKNNSGKLSVEGMVAAEFPEFGFDGYSALFGAIKNEDKFHFHFRTAGQWVP